MSNLPTPEKLSPEHMFTLYQISGVMNSSLDFDDVLSNVMDAIMQVTKAQRGFLMIADSETGELEVLISHGIDGATIEQEGYSTTIVNHVVESREALLTNNAQFDTRFTPGQSIIIRGLRAILCAPMIVQDRLVGVVYVDTSMKSGSFTESDRELLNAVAGQAGRAIENARLYRVAVIKGRMESELQMASRIQRGLLPSMPSMPGYEVVATLEPAREVSGDFYDAFRPTEQALGIVIADVSDKGAPAAMFMAVARTFFRSLAHAGLSPIETLRQTNDLILDDAENGGMFVTAYHSLFDRDGRSVHVNAGHNPPLHYRHATRELTFMPTGGRAVGWFPDLPVEEIHLQMEPGDVMVYYTDGVTEAENPQGGYFGEERLAQALGQIVGHSAQEILEYIVQSVTTFCDGAPPFDDLTLLVVRYTG